jgi:serine/threonine-protein kinase/endoribonuclease IRE1
MSGRNGAKGKGASNGDLIEDDAILSQYEHGEYVAKISDMGLGKQLTGQSSFGPSTLGKSSIQGAGNGGESSRLTGAGPGSVGWQAPEVMAVRWSSETPSVKSGNSSRTDSFLLDASSLDAPTSSRTSRSVDIFSLGCIFHCTLVPGSHPFGDWYEREANIMRNKAATGELLEASPDAHDLITSMICRDASQRPTAKEVCEHPLFWHPQKKLAFLCDISDRIESESQLVDDGKEPLTRFGANVFAIERNAAMVVGTAWDQDLDPDLLSNVSKFRSYDTSSVRDCLRLIRNKHHHYDELPAHVKERVGPNPEGLLSYFEQNFPHLLMHCYNTSKALFDVNDSLALKYSIAISPRLKNRLIAPTAKTQSMDSNDGTQEVEPPKEVEDRAPPTDACDLDLPTQKQDAPQDEISEWESMNGEEPMPAEGPALPSIPNAPNLPGDGDIVLWEGSTSAKAFNCRGWLRGDDEWARQPPARKKLDSNMTRCATDAKFRTRLCNHWDVSLGTFCPMKKRNKCVFAHGPVELRVKEGKKHRWGKLVDSSGNNSNPKHSGGEDTYGAARSIESIRKEEGKWNTEKGSKNDKSRGKGKATPAKVAVAQDPSSPVKA